MKIEKVKGSLDFHHIRDSSLNSKEKTFTIAAGPRVTSV